MKKEYKRIVWSTWAVIFVCLFSLAALHFNRTVDLKGCAFPWSQIELSPSGAQNGSIVHGQKTVVLILSEDCSFCQELNQCYELNDFASKFPSVYFIYLYKGNGSRSINTVSKLHPNSYGFRIVRLPNSLEGGVPRIIFLNRQGIVEYDRVGTRSSSTELELLSEFAKN